MLRPRSGRRRPGLPKRRPQLASPHRESPERRRPRTGPSGPRGRAGPLHCLSNARAPVSRSARQPPAAPPEGARQGARPSRRCRSRRGARRTRDSPSSPRQVEPAQAGAVGGATHLPRTADWRGARCRRRPAAPSEVGRLRRGPGPPCRAEPREWLPPRAHPAGCRAGKDEDRRGTSRSRAAARSPRSGRSRAPGRDASPVRPPRSGRRPAWRPPSRRWRRGTAR